MAGQTTGQGGSAGTTSAGTKAPKGAESAASLTKAEQEQLRATDTADTSPRAAAPNLSGDRVRAIFWGGGTTKEVSKADFKRFGVDHPSVVFDFRKDNATLPVDPKKGFVGLTREAADFLTGRFPTEFEYLDRGNEEAEDEDDSEDG